MSRFREHGVTMVELAVALGFVGIVLTLAIGYYTSLVRRTRATQVMADLYAVRAAGYIYFAESGTWPREYGPGHAPPELADYLPRSINFRNKFYQLDWENWRGTPRSPRTGIVIGVSVVTNDLGLLGDVEKLIANANFRRVSRRKSTLEILGPGGL
jgi:general secretion pathway protein G